MCPNNVSSLILVLYSLNGSEVNTIMKGQFIIILLLAVVLFDNIFSQTVKNGVRVGSPYPTISPAFEEDLPPSLVVVVTRLYQSYYQLASASWYVLVATRARAGREMILPITLYFSAFARANVLLGLNLGSWHFTI